MRHAVLAPAVLLLLLLLGSAGCVQSWPHLARNDFASSYWCPVNQIEVRAEPGSDRSYHVAGCGLEVTYVCGGTGDSGGCQARQRVEFEATDGTAHGAWLDEDPNANNAMSREAAIASGVRDVPCDRAALRVVGGDPQGFASTIEGCGERVTYQVADVADQTATTHSGPVTKHKYVVINRLPLAAPTAPPATASAAPVPAPVPAPAPAPAAPAAPAPTTAPAPAPATAHAPAPTPAPTSVPTPSPSSSALSTPR